MFAHLGRKRVGGVNNMCNLFSFQIRYQPVNAAETADAFFDRLGPGPLNTPCIRKSGLYLCFGDNLSQS